MKKIFFVPLILSLGVISGFVAPSVFATGKPEKVTICHVAGRADDPANHITLTLPYVAVYGQAGHFFENGTTQAGHEQDYLGACKGDETTTTDTTDTTTTDTTTTTETNTTTETETTPRPPCPVTPENPTGALPNPPGGKDGKPGNDDCIPDPVETATQETESTPVPPTVTTPTVPTETTEPQETVTEEEREEATPVSKEKLEKELEKQAKKNAKINPSSDVRVDKNELPRTGLPLGLVSLIGLGMVGSGILMRRLSG